MRFLIDESAGIGVTEYLRTAGHDVLAVAELSPEIDDEIVLAWAVRETRILVTNDKDFGELVFRSAQPLMESCCFVFKTKAPQIP